MDRARMEELVRYLKRLRHFRLNDQPIIRFILSCTGGVQEIRVNLSSHNDDYSLYTLVTANSQVVRSTCRQGCDPVHDWLELSQVGDEVEKQVAHVLLDHDEDLRKDFLQLALFKQARQEEK